MACDWCYMLVMAGCFAMLYGHRAAEIRPNVLLIVADDLGIGDVGCFGNDTIRTPNLDRLALEGAKLTHHLAAASICTPSRAALMTGRYPIRIGMAPKNFFRVNSFLASASGLPPDEVTVGEIAKENGYRTGLIGKWHLGLHCRNRTDFCHHPNRQGFDYYYGLPLTNVRDFGPECRQNVIRAKFPFIDNLLLSVLLGGVVFGFFLKKADYVGRPGVAVILALVISPVACVYAIMYGMRYWNGVVMRDLAVVEQPVELGGFTAMLVAEGRRFIEGRAAEGQPFLLVVSLIQVHTALHAGERFKGKSRHGPYGDEVEEMDWSVGQLLDDLDRLGIANNTFVYFTSDNGGHVEERGIHGNREGGWNGIYRGGKGQGGMDGGIRVPTLVRWPGVVKPGTVIDVPTSMMDVLPTVVSVIDGQLPTDRKIDGVDILPLLAADQSAKPPHKLLVHYCCETVHAARYTPGNGSDVYKVHFATPKWDLGTEGCGFICECHDDAVTWHDPPLMFNIARDRSERSPIDPKSTAYAETLREIDRLLEEHKRGINGAESEFENIKIAPRPWLQPCCNFPTCTCIDSRRSELTNE